MKKISIVTGGSRGIGKAIMEMLQQKHREVWEISRKSNTVKNGRHLSIDLNKMQFTELSKLLKKNNPEIEFLVLNAGRAFARPMTETTKKDLQEIFNINVFSNYEILKICKPYLKKGAKVVFFSSLAGLEKFSKFPGFTAYAMTKACMVNLRDTVASEWPEIEIHCISPGSVDTEMFSSVAPKGFVAKYRPSDVAKLCEKILLKKKLVGRNWILA